MIPVNNAITVAVIAVVIVAAIVAWAARGYWRTRVSDAYQDGHAAGIQTQIGRQNRALGRRRADDKRVLDAYLERLRDPRPGEPATEVIVASVTGVPRRHPAHQLAPDLPFPEALPPGLREYATQAMAAADAAKWAQAS